jgi:hypothetical protein
LTPHGVVEGEITWTLTDAGTDKWLKARKKAGDKGVERVAGSYIDGKLSLVGSEVTDEVLLGTCDYELTLMEDGKFQGRSHHHEYGGGTMNGTAHCF